MFYQFVSVVGALMILSAYVAYQMGKLGREDRLYSLLNFVGSSLLAWIAIIDVRWGFIVLEVVWALISLPPLIRPPGRHDPSTAKL
ncbi:MAG TPA: hypothetical protein VFI91_07445 [Longimicrobiaceae bacterium]|nr:hypothetical protein [Longimicrobiaceae bacterium]